MELSKWIESTEALLELNRKGKVTHNIPGHAVTLLEEALLRAHDEQLARNVSEFPRRGEEFFIKHDGFHGSVIGEYLTRDGKKGVVLQMIGTRVVHVYGEKWLERG